MITQHFMLRHAGLFQEKAFIGGDWMAARSGKTFTVYDPYDRSPLASVPDLAEVDMEQAVSAAKAAFGPWSALTGFDRGSILERWYRLVLEHADDLAKLLTAEQGKPLAEALAEVRYGASFIAWFAGEAPRVYGDLIPSPDAGKRFSVLRQPVGVVAAITPWNFPNAMITRKIAPALAAGCTVVVKPAEDTPLSALALAALGQEAGIPDGVLNIVTTANPKAAGDFICAHPDIRKISFTGSTRTGKLLMAKGAATLKRLSLELGGNAPFLVFEDANLEEAVVGAMASKYRNAGQTCVCTNRFLIQDSVIDTFRDMLVQASASLKIGHGFVEGVQIGPLINQAAGEKVRNLLQDALSKGATIAHSRPFSESDTVIPPIVISGVTEEMTLAGEEIFGPISALSSFSTEAEAIALANGTSYGLASYLYTNNMSRAVRVSEALEYGMVGINTGVISYASAPFGGIKESGFGREGSRYGMDEYLALKYICTDVRG